MSKIALYNLEPHIVNTAMMQVSSYHKGIGDDIYIYSPLFHDTYDKIYAFSIFDFTPKDYVRDDMITGGTGFSLTSRLPSYIESCDYDWSLYPDCDFSIIWFSRGCIRKCPFCVVSQKEGYIKPVEPKNLNPNMKYVKVMDNNFFANPNWHEAVDTLLEWDYPVDIQGFDIRLFDEEQSYAINELDHYNRVKFAWDNPRDNLDDKIQLLLDNVSYSKVMCYVLIGYWSTPEEDLYRVMHLSEEFKVDAFVMPYNKFDNYQLNFARWCNNKVLFRTRTWEEYQAGYDHSVEDYERLLRNRRKKEIKENQEVFDV